MKLNVDISHTAFGARQGTVSTKRGSFQTPIFMPVGTRGAIRTIAAHDYKKLGAEIVLGNTYHLMLRPGSDVVKSLGGLAQFTGWEGLTLTDSGGFQVFSLSPKLDDNGVCFRSTYDGSIIDFTPEEAVRVQEDIGADIQMVLDVCSALPSSTEELRDAMIRTFEWAKRAKKSHTRIDDQSLFGIVQGGDSKQLRIESTKRTVSLDFDGYAIGGLSVGESQEVMLDMLDAIFGNGDLPAGQPRYLMGVGDPVGIIESVMRGVDMFDCVLPTRLGRHGVLLTWQGKRHIRNEKYSRDDRPIDPDCMCEVCSRYSRGFIRHLVAQREPSALYLCTLHNISWMFQYMNTIRKAIADGEKAFIDLRDEIHSIY